MRKYSFDDFLIKFFSKPSVDFIAVIGCTYVRFNLLNRFKIILYCHCRLFNYLYHYCHSVVIA